MPIVRVAGSLPSRSLSRYRGIENFLPNAGTVF